MENTVSVTYLGEEREENVATNAFDCEIRSHIPCKLQRVFLSTKALICRLERTFPTKLRSSRLHVSKMAEVSMATKRFDHLPQKGLKFSHSPRISYVIIIWGRRRESVGPKKKKNKTQGCRRRVRGNCR